MTDLEDLYAVSELLEKIIDKHSLGWTLTGISRICQERANRKVGNKKLSNNWKKAGDRIGQCRDHDDIQRVSFEPNGEE